MMEEAYKRYMNNWDKELPRIGPCTQEEFINKIKTDKEFAKTWGVKVEVRELSLDERYVLANINGSKEKLTGEPNYTEEQQHSMLDELVPTKAISLTYDNRTEVIYE